VKVEAIEYGDRKVYSVSAFNRGVGSWLERLPSVWIEGEVTELRRQERWQSVFFTLKDAGDGFDVARRDGDILRLGYWFPLLSDETRRPATVRRCKARFQSVACVSRRRPTDLTSIRFATFTQAISKTNPTAASRASRLGRT